MQTQSRDQITPAHAPAAPTAPGAPTTDALPPLPAIPRGGGRLIVDNRGDQTVFTATSLPPDYLGVVQTAQETAFGLMGMLVVIVLLGPFARLLARRIEKRAEMAAPVAHNALLEQQLSQLQQSVDAMSVEIERISESQRFQSKLLYEKQSQVIPS